MNMLVFIIEVFLWVINLTASNPGNVNEVEKLKITTKAQFMMDGRLREMEDSFCIYQWKGAKIFEFNYHETLEDMDTILKDEVKYMYFRYNPAGNLGYIFSSLDDSAYSRTCDADSMLHEFANKSVDYFTIVNNGKMIRKFDGPSKDQKTYVYAPLQKRDASYSDSTYLIFSDKFKDVNFSFSKAADSVLKSKLVGARFVFNETFSGTLRIPKREIVVRLERIEAANSKEIRHFLARNKFL